MDRTHLAKPLPAAQRLREALDESAKLDAGVMRLQMLGSLLTLAAKAQQASAMTNGEIDDKLNGAQDDDDIMKALRATRTGK